MKTTLIFLMILLVSISMAQIPTNGLVAYYPFNGNANDESGNSNHADQIFGSVQYIANGRIGQAVKFGGFFNPGHIRIPSSASLNFTNSASFSFWYRIDSMAGCNTYGQYASTSCMAMFSKDNDNHGLGYVAFPQQGTIHNGFFSGPGIPNNCYGTGPLNTNYLGQWMHAVILFKPDVIKIYVNGQAVLSVSCGNVFYLSANGRPLYFGKFSNTWYPLNGAIDQVRIYNRELTLSEITDLYGEGSCNLPLPIVQNASGCNGGTYVLTASGGINYNWYSVASGGAVIGTGSSFITPYLTQSDTFWVTNVDGNCESARVPASVTVITAHIANNDTTITAGQSLTLNLIVNTPPVPTNGLLGYWPFNGNANDMSLNGSNGLIHNTTLCGDRFGKQDSAFAFSGLVGNSYIDIGNLNQTSSMGAMTISLWINKSDSNRTEGFIGKWNTTSSTDNSFLLYNGEQTKLNKGRFSLKFSDNSVSVVSGTTSIPTNQWVNIIGTFDNQTGRIKLFKNGILDNMVIDSSSIGKIIKYHTSYSAKIGNWGSLKTNGTYDFKGKIDDIRIYNHALNDQEINNLYHERNYNLDYSFVWSTGATTPTITVSPTQTTTYTVTITSGNTYCVDSVTVISTQTILSGKLSYDNTAQTPLSCTQVFLKNTMGIIVDTAVTDQNGDYAFNSIPDGTYTLGAASTKTWGGVNNVDGLQILKHFTGYITLTGLPYLAADVNGNSYVNSSDALVVAKRFVSYISSFSIPDWIFEEPSVTISGTTPQVVNFKGICAGDANGSFVPPACGN